MAACHDTRGARASVRVVASDSVGVAEPTKMLSRDALRSSGPHGGTRGYSTRGKVDLVYVAPLLPPFFCRSPGSTW